jgi:hypothetical protein
MVLAWGILRGVLLCPAAGQVWGWPDLEYTGQQPVLLLCC